MAKVLRPCYCGKFEFGQTIEVDGQPDFDGYTTECKAHTYNIFAQGHDAKLVGFMVRAELAGEEITLTEGGVTTTFGGAVGAAARISDRLALKAQAMLDAAKARVAKKAAREAGRVAKQSAKAAKVEEPRTREAAVKVGRWVYDAQIDLVTGTATFTSKKGEVKQAVFGEYTEVDSL